VPWPGAPQTAIDAWRERWPVRVPRWGLKDAWLSLVATMVASVAVGLLLLVDPDSRSWTNTVILLSLVAQWVPMLGWPLVAARARGNGAVIDFGLEVRRSDLAWGLGGGLVVLMVAGAIGWATQQIAGDFNSSAGELVEGFRDEAIPLLLLAAAIGIGAPVVEEIFFRGLFWGAVAKRGINPWWATVVSALVFSLVHLEPVRIPLLFVTGLLLGYLRQRTGRIGASILAHMVNNMAAVLALFLI